MLRCIPPLRDGRLIDALSGKIERHFPKGALQSGTRGVKANRSGNGYCFDGLVEDEEGGLVVDHVLFRSVFGFFFSGRIDTEGGSCQHGGGQHSDANPALERSGAD